MTETRPDAVHKLQYRGALGIVKILCRSAYALASDRCSMWWKDVTCAECIAKRKKS